MKKNTLTLILCLIIAMGYSQKSIEDHAVVKKIDDTKSGNYKDVLSSFFQLASKNFSEDGKSIEFNSTLFAVKSEINPDLLLDKNIKNEYFARNFQFNVKFDLDEDYKYKGFTGGLTYALINGRDASVAVFTNTVYGQEYMNFSTALIDIQTRLISEIDSTLSDEKQTEQQDLIEKAIEDIENNRIGEVTANPYYDKIFSQYASLVNGNASINEKTVVEAVSHLDKLEKEAYKEIEAKPLLTLSADGSANDEGDFNKGSLGMVFLKGNKDGWEEIDLRANLSYADTLATVLPLLRTTAVNATKATDNTKTRAVFKATAGVNFKIGKKAGEESYFEIKAAAEYNSILKNKLEDEKKDNFLANAEFRLRVAKDLWIPLTVKYDVENENFLGFLNVSYNFK